MTLQRRLIIPIILILSVTWLGAAYYTKKAAFNKSREFLIDQTKAQAENWVLVLQQFDNKPATITGKPNEAILAWQGDILVLSTGVLQLEKPIKDNDYIQIIGHDKWLMSDRCIDSTCVSVGTRDTDRKYAVRWLVVTIYLPLFIFFVIGVTTAVMAIRIALRPLNVLAHTVEATPIDRLQPLPNEGYENELKPLVKALNGLMQNLKTNWIKNAHS